MYRINRLNRNVLIVEDEVIFHAATEDTLNPRRIAQAIIIAEERIIRPALGFEFYDLLRAQKNQVVTSGNLATLQTQINASLGAGVELPVLVEGDIVNSSTFLSADNLLLWNEILWKLTAEAVRFVALPQNFASLSSTGVIHNHPTAQGLSGESVTTPDLRSMKWLVDRAMSDAVDPLTSAMHVWVCKNLSKYPKYGNACPSCGGNENSGNRKLDVLLDIYDD